MNTQSRPFIDRSGHVIVPGGFCTLSEGQRLAMDDIRSASDRMIRSISGWRACMSCDGGDESRDPRLHPAYAVLTIAAAIAFVRVQRSRDGRDTVILACDTRPTGAELVDTFVRAFTYLGISVRLAGALSVCEAAAITGTDPDAGGLCYVTASHNPQGYNGFKFMNGDGMVLPAEDAAEVIHLFESTVSRWDAFEKLHRIVHHVDPQAVQTVYSHQKKCREDARAAYRSLLEHRVSSPWSFAELKENTRSVEVFSDMNGSARCMGPDREFLQDWGMRFRSINDIPGSIAHAIEPEGAALNDCKTRMENALIGYVPDNDGDRGNLVLNPSRTDAHTLSGQEVFALSVVAELAMESLRYQKLKNDTRSAIVVNGPTSLRIERIAAAFDVDVFRSEVGEANVLERARLLREDGYRVPIIGEGSNGGNITFPGTIRDPLSTISSIIRLVAWRPTYDQSDSSPAAQAFAALGIAGDPSLLEPGDILQEILNGLPVFLTTQTTDPSARIEVNRLDHKRLKEAYEALLPDEIRKLKTRSEFTWLRDYRVHNFEGPDVRTGPGNRNPEGDESGGLAVHLYDEANTARAFVWFRGSRTEPILRIISDIEGNTSAALQILMEMQKRLINRSAKNCAELY